MNDLHMAVDLGKPGGDYTGMAVRCLDCGYFNSESIKCPTTQAELKVMALRLWKDRRCRE